MAYFSLPRRRTRQARPRDAGRRLLDGAPVEHRRGAERRAPAWPRRTPPASLALLRPRPDAGEASGATRGSFEQALMVTAHPIARRHLPRRRHRHARRAGGVAVARERADRARGRRAVRGGQGATAAFLRRARGAAATPCSDSSASPPAGGAARRHPPERQPLAPPPPSCNWARASPRSRDLPPRCLVRAGVYVGVVTGWGPTRSPVRSFRLVNTVVVPIRANAMVADLGRLQAGQSAGSSLPSIRARSRSPSPTRRRRAARRAAPAERPAISGGGRRSAPGPATRRPSSWWTPPTWAGL